jgi:hypothetical protein
MWYSAHIIIIFRSQICPFLRLVSLRVVNNYSTDIVCCCLTPGGDLFFMETLLKAVEKPGGRHLLHTNYGVLRTTTRIYRARRKQRRLICVEKAKLGANLQEMRSAT